MHQLPLALGAVLFILMLSIACQSTPTEEAAAPAEEMPAAAQEYTLNGRVVSLQEETMTATIDHSEIVGWMDAMTMPFPVRDKAEWAKLQEGATIQATVFVEDSGYYIGNIEVGEPAMGEEAP